MRRKTDAWSTLALLEMCVGWTKEAKLCCSTLDWCFHCSHGRNHHQGIEQGLNFVAVQSNGALIAVLGGIVTVQQIKG